MGLRSCLAGHWRIAGLLLAAATLPAALFQGAASRPALAEGSIARAIAAAAPGSTVVIPAGLYPEQVVVDKPLTLVGQDWPVIDGGGAGDVVTISADNVTLRGFVVRGSNLEPSAEPAGIRVRGNNAVVEGNRLERVLYGISLQQGGGNTVRDNTISSIPEFPSDRRGHAVYLWYSNGNTVINNTVTDAKDGLFLSFASNNRLENNSVRDSRYGIHYMYADNNTFLHNTFRSNVAGAAIMYSKNVTLVGNEFADNRSVASGYGILFKDVDNIDVSDNFIHHNRIGLLMEGAPLSPEGYVTIRHNLIGYNRTALEMATTTNATFTENTFAGNLQQAQTSGAGLLGHNQWQLDGRGNFWDDYQGYDTGGDGVGDLPYRYQNLYDDMVRDNEALKAYQFTPAQTAIEFAARWFPSYRPDPLVTDPDPLVGRTMSLPSTGGSGHTARSAGAMLTIAAVAALLVWRLGRRPHGVWQC